MGCRFRKSSFFVLSLVVVLGPIHAANKDRLDLPFGGSKKRTWKDIIPVGSLAGSRAITFQRLEGVIVTEPGKTIAKKPRRRGRRRRRQKSDPTKASGLRVSPIEKGVRFFATEKAEAGQVYRVRYTARFSTRVWRQHRRGRGSWANGAPITRKYDTTVVITLPRSFKQRVLRVGANSTLSFHEALELEKVTSSSKSVSAEIGEKSRSLAFRAEKEGSARLCLRYRLFGKRYRVVVPVRCVDADQDDADLAKSQGLRESEAQVGESET